MILLPQVSSLSTFSLQKELWWLEKCFVSPLYLDGMETRCRVQKPSSSTLVMILFIDSLKCVLSKKGLCDLRRIFTRTSGTRGSGWCLRVTEGFQIHPSNFLSSLIGLTVPLVQSSHLRFEIDSGGFKLGRTSLRGLDDVCMCDKMSLNSPK